MNIVWQRTDPVKLMWRRFAMLGTFLLVLAAGGAVWNVYDKAKESGVQRVLAEAQMKDLAERKNRVSAQIKSLETDRGKEEALRSQYEIGKEGENLIIIVDEKQATATATTTPPKSWYQRAFGW